MMARARSDDATVSWNTPVPSRLNAAAEARMLSRGFNSKAEYVRSLIRDDVEEAAPIGL